MTTYTRVGEHVPTPLPIIFSSLLGSPCQCVLIHFFVTLLQEHHTSTSLNSSGTVLNSLHRFSHPAVWATLRLITSRYFWSGMNAHVCKWARSCLQCQRGKVTHHIITSLSTFNTHNARFNHVYIDLVGPLPMLHLSAHINWLIHSMAKSFADTRQFFRHSSPSFRQWMDIILQCTLNHHKWPRSTIRIITMETPHEFPGYSINLDNTVPPHSQWPGRTFSLAVERSHKVFIRYYSVDQSISSHPVICTTIKQNCHCTAAELVYGTTLRLPGDCFNSTSTSS